MAEPLRDFRRYFGKRSCNRASDATNAQTGSLESVRPPLPFIPVPLPPLRPLQRRPMSKEEKCCGAGNNGRHGIGSGGCLYSLKSLGGNVSEVGRDGCRMMAKVAGPSLKVTSESPQRRWRRWRRTKRRWGGSHLISSNVNVGFFSFSLS